MKNYFIILVPVVVPDLKIDMKKARKIMKSMEEGTDNLLNLLEDELEKIQDSVFNSLETCFTSIHSLIEESILDFNFILETEDYSQFKAEVDIFMPEIEQYLFNTKESCNLAVEPLYLEKIELLKQAGKQMEHVMNSGEFFFSCQSLLLELEHNQAQLEAILTFISTQYNNTKAHALEMIELTLRNIEHAQSKLHTNLSSQLWIDEEKRDLRQRSTFIIRFYRMVSKILFSKDSVVDTKRFEENVLLSLNEVEETGDKVLNSFKEQCQRSVEEAEIKKPFLSVNTGYFFLSSRCFDLTCSLFYIESSIRAEIF